MSINASSRRDATNVAANSEGREHVGINASFKSASENNNIQQVLDGNDETRHNILDEVSELSVPETRIDRQTHTHHSTYSYHLTERTKSIDYQKRKLENEHARKLSTFTRHFGFRSTYWRRLSFFLHASWKKTKNKPSFLLDSKNLAIFSSNIFLIPPLIKINILLLFISAANTFLK